MNVSVFAWRLIRDRLPSKANLAIRDVISADDIFYVSGCGHVETAEHLFLSCSTFASLWQQVRNWIGFLGVDSNIIADHLVQFTHQVMVKLKVHSCGLFGFCVLGLYGMNLTTVCSIILLLLLLAC